MILYSPNISTISLGPLVIHIYALCILAGASLCTIVAAYRWQNNSGLNSLGDIYNLFLIVMPCGIIGARLYHVCITAPGYYFGIGWGGNNSGAHLTEIPQIAQGGLGIYGGIIAGLVAGFTYCKVRKINFAHLADCVLPCVLLAQGIGRLGNYFNQELFGRPTGEQQSDGTWTIGNWGLKIDHSAIAPNGQYLPSGMLYHPTFLYEMLWDIAGFFILVFLLNKFINRKNFKRGSLAICYMIYYSLGRFIMEMFRIDPAPSYLGIRIHGWVAILGVVLASCALIILNSKKFLQTENVV